MPYHVRITPRDRGNRPRDALALDKDATWIEEHIAAPRRQGLDIFIDGQVFSWDGIDKIHITETGQPSEKILPQIRSRRRSEGTPTPMSDSWYVAKEGLDVTDQFISGRPGTNPRAADRAVAFASNRKAVMVICGHDRQANAALFDWLRAVGLEPREWTQLIGASGSASPYVGQVLDAALRDVQAVVAFFTPDEYVTASSALLERRSAGRFQSRPNVLIEAGMALITHPTRTVLVVLGHLDLPSDLAGRYYIHLSHADAAPLKDLANRLGKAGCQINLSGTAWLDPARFPDREQVGVCGDAAQHAPSAVIANPLSGQLVPRAVWAQGSASNIAGGLTLWLVVLAGRSYYPQAKIRLPVGGTGTWDQLVHFGRVDGSGGHHYTLYAVGANEAAARVFEDYFRQRAAGQDPGPLSDAAGTYPDVQTYAAAHVIRAEPEDQNRPAS